MNDDELPEVVYLDGEEADWVFWPPPGEHLPEWFADLCECGGHGCLGPSWHDPGCPVVLEAWKWRAKILHEQVWELLDEVQALEAENAQLRARPFSWPLVTITSPTLATDARCDACRDSEICYCTRNPSRLRWG